MLYRYEDGYEDSGPPTAYRNPSYTPADKYESDNYNKDYRLSAEDRAYEEYSREPPSKFDDDGAPLEKPPYDPHSSTSV